MKLLDSVQYLKGVGEKRAKLYEKLGVDHIYSLLHFYPRAYLDFSTPVSLDEAPLNELSCVKVKIFQKLSPQMIRKGLTIFRVLATDGTRDLTVTIFNSKFGFDGLKLEQTYHLYGKMQGSQFHKEMQNPLVFDPQSGNAIQPVYPQTEGLGSKAIARNMAQALTLLDDHLKDPLPESIRRAQQLCHYSYAYHNIHFPQDMQALQTARRRLIFDELLTLQLGLSLLKTRTRESTPIRVDAVDMSDFYSILPFSLTDDQQTVIEQSLADMNSDVPMNRLVQGDVGSGKTVVSCALAFALAKQGYQTAVMAPTELLAMQHARVFEEMLKPLGIEVALLTGSLTASQKKKVKQRIETGDVTVVIGTHALIQDSVCFDKLGLVVTDEQHRFGVNQRSALAQKGDNPHKLVMSATPIPRTLALIIYGDLDVSSIKTVPHGRLPIQTFFVSGKKRARAHGFIKEHIDAGEQAYIVCPLIEPSELMEQEDMQTVTTYVKELQKGVLGEVKIGMLHGKQKPAEKERVMRAFKQGELDLLVATTVVEVGVDVPLATIMMVENAEHFGLSQLHQLRGRVGRGSTQSYCILVSDAKGDVTKQRLQTMVKSSDGFYISEQDLKLRGPGDFFGARQHGLPALKIADMVDDMQLLLQCQAIANDVLANDPKLQKSENRGLSRMVKLLFESQQDG